MNACRIWLVVLALALAVGLASAETSWQVQPGTRFDRGPAEEAWKPLSRIEGVLALVNRSSFKDLPGSTALDHVWYRRTYEIPDAWTGRSVWLRIDQVEGRAVVRIGGRALGEVSRTSPEIDITPAVRPGHQVTVEIFVTRDPAAAGLVPQPDPIIDHILAWLKKPRASGLGLVGDPQVFARGGQAWVGGIEVRTLQSAGRIEVRIAAGGRLEGLRCQATVLPLTDPGEPAVPLQAVPAQAAMAVGGAFTGRPWRLEAPHLYRLEARLVDADGREVDRSELRFGVREVVIRGREVLLNGRRTPWRMMGPITWSTANGWPDATAFSPDSAIGRFWSTLGVNLWQVQPNGDLWWQNLPRGGGVTSWQVVDDRILTRCDEAGIGITLPVPPMATNQGLILPIDRDPAVRAAYRKEVAAYLARYRHHPCIQSYTLGMNLLDTTTYMRNISPQGMGLSHDGPGTPARMRDAIAAAVRIVHEVDPTVPAYVHAGGWWGGDLHGANQHMNLLPLAEYERWPAQWSVQGQAPWVADEAGMPFLGDFIYRRYGASGFDAKDPELAITETCAEILGDEAYRLETPGMRRDPRAGIGHLEQYGTTHVLAPERHARFPALDRVMCQYYPRVLHAWRSLGIQGTVPWLMEWSYAWQSPSPADNLAAAYAGANQRLMAFIGGGSDQWRRERHIGAGETVERSAVVVYDGPRESCTAEVRWQLADAAGLVLASGGGPAEVAAGRRAAVPIRFTAPAVAARTEAVLSLAVSGDGIDQRDAMPMVVWPAMVRPDPVEARIIDPSGRTVAAFAGLLRNDANSGLLVIGPRALAGMARLPYTAAEVEAGLHVLILEQSAEDLFRLGLRSEERGFRQAFVREPADLHGLVDGDLADWRGDAGLVTAEAPPSYWAHRIIMLGTKAQRPARCGTHGNVVSVAIETPQRGAFRPLIECGFDLAYTPLLEWRHGRGRVLFCQLDLTGRVGLDPAATRAAVAVLGAATAAVAPDRPIQVAGSGPEAQAIGRLGFASGTAPQALVVAPSGPADLVYATRESATASLDASADLTPRRVGGITIGPALQRFRTVLPAAPGGMVVAGPATACQVAITAADGMPKVVGRLSALRLRGLYQRLLTGLGARSSADVAERITALGAAPVPPGSASPELVALGELQVTEPAQVAGLSGRDLLQAPWDPASLRWQDLKPLLARRDAAGYGGEASAGHADLAAAFAIRPSIDRRAAVRTRFSLPTAATINLYAGADYWATVMLDGQPVVDLSQQVGAPDRLSGRVRRDLAAGEHTLEVRLVSGSNGFWAFLAVDTAPTPRGKADFIPDIAKHGRWMRPYNPPGSEALYAAPRGDDDDPYLYYLW